MTDTDHRAEAERLSVAYPFDATEHLLAALLDGQQVQTEWLHRIRDLLSITYDLHAERTPKPATTCLACGVDGCGHDEPEVHAIRDASWDIPPLARDGAKPDPLPGLPEAADLLDALRERGWDVTPRQPKVERPERGTVTVTLPRDVVEGAQGALYGAIRLIRRAGNVVDAGRIEDAAVDLERALDAASATQEADQ